MAKDAVTPDWDKIVYAPERVGKWIKGELTLQELNVISGPEMLEMAVIGFSMYEQGKYDHAKVIFQGLCALDPKEAYYRTALGAVYLAQENLEQAEGLLSEAIALNDKEIASFVNRGEVYLRQGKIMEAAQDFKRAVELDPDNKDPLSHRARLLAAAAVETIHAAQREANPKAAPSTTRATSPGRVPVAAVAAKSPAPGAPAKKK
jgi:tetratricopeptide (TPR) repeat protein